MENEMENLSCNFPREFSALSFPRLPRHDDDGDIVSIGEHVSWD